MNIKEQLGEKELVNLLAVYPDKDLDSKYSSLNKVLIGALVVVTILKLLSILELLMGGMSVQAVAGLLLFGLLINGAAIYAIYIKHVLAYRIVALFCLQGVTKFLDPTLISQYSSILDWGWFALSLLCLAIVIWLGFSIPKKVFPYHGWFKPRTQDNGAPMFTAAQMP